MQDSLRLAVGGSYRMGMIAADMSSQKSPATEKADILERPKNNHPSGGIQQVSVLT